MLESILKIEFQKLVGVPFYNLLIILCLPDGADMITDTHV